MFNILSFIERPLTWQLFSGGHVVHRPNPEWEGGDIKVTLEAVKLRFGIEFDSELWSTVQISFQGTRRVL